MNRSRAGLYTTLGWLAVASLTFALGWVSLSAWGASPTGGATKGYLAKPFVPAGGNTPPLISSIGGQFISEDSSAGPIPFTVADLETPSTNLTVSAVSTNLTLVPATNYVFGGSGGSRTIRVIPTRDQFGITAVTVTVSDGSLTASTSFLLTVASVNDLPTISTVPDQTILQDQSTAVLPFVVGDVETPAASLTVTADSSTSLFPNSNIYLGGSGSIRTVQLVPTPGTIGTAVISLTVTDGNNATMKRMFQVTVEPGIPPSILVHPQSLAVAVGSDAVLNVIAAGSPPLSYQWLLSGANLVGATNSLLLLRQARGVNSGDYRAVVANPYGSVTSDVATLTVALVPRGSIWNYRDTGEDLGSDWRLPGFDDGAWSSNRAEFGYGETNSVTVVGYGNNVTNKYVTTYFRTSFSVDAVSLYTNLLLRLLRDDGAVVYLNGVEVHRANLPLGDIAFDTLALTEVDGADQRRFFEAQIHPALLRQSLNVFAVEVHQSARDGPDLSFDLELIGAGGDPPQIAGQPLSQTVSLGTTNLTLQVTPAGVGPFQYIWQLNGLDIPGATNATYTIPGVLPENGGSYRVVVINKSGAVASEAAVVLVDLALASGGDAFQDRTLLFSTNGLLRGGSSAATKQPGEPPHANKQGGKSVWYSWTATGSGIASFDTRGSAFDTLLAVYTGASVSNLTLVTADEDAGGFYTSAVRFNAEANRVYAIAVDGVGFGGAGGPYVLRWNLAPDNRRVPVIVHGPESQGVQPRATAVFSVEVDDPVGVTFQWYFNGLAILGETSSMLVLSDVGPLQVGRYSVRVDNNLAPPVFSAPALLQVGSQDGIYVYDKLEDLFPDGFVGAGGSGGSGGSGFRTASAAARFRAAGFALPPASGTIGMRFGSAHYVNVPPGSNNVSDPLPGLQWGPGSLWFVVMNQDSLPIEIDTAGSLNSSGSEALVRIAVYDAASLIEYLTDASRTLLPPAPLTYGPESPLDHPPYHVRINAPANGVLAVLLTPDNCASADSCLPSVVRISVRTRPVAYFRKSGERVALRLPTGIDPLPGGNTTSALRRNGQVLRVGPIASPFTIPSVDCEDAGTYDLFISNNRTNVSLPFAMLFVNEDAHAYSELVDANGLRFVRVIAYCEESLKLERSSGLPSLDNADRWAEVRMVDADVERPLILFEGVGGASLEPRRFVFRATPWLVPGTVCRRCETPRPPPCASPSYP